MKVYIPTYGRADDQPAYAQLTDAGLRPILVVDNRDDYHYKGFRHIRSEFAGISDKRHAIMQLHPRGSRFCVVDDDIIIRKVVTPIMWSERRSPSTPVADSQQVRDLFAYASVLLDECAQVGVHVREYINGKWPWTHTYNTGRYPLRMVFYNKDKMLAVPQACPTRTGEDLWMWLSLIRQGLPYATITGWCNDSRRNVSNFTHKEKIADQLRLIKLLDIEQYVRYRNGKPVVQYTALARKYLGSA